MSEIHNFRRSLKKNTSHHKFMVINIFVDSLDDKLKSIYLESAKKHNEKIINDPQFYDAGFDIFLPKNEDETDVNSWGDGTAFYSRNWVDKPINKVDFKIKCSAQIHHIPKYWTEDEHSYYMPYYTPFFTYARSSISKTPLRLANNQGIIDAGYRGNIIGMFDCLTSCNKENSDFDWYMEKYSRILQICAPDLAPIYVNIVNTLDELGPSTSRGTGGIGSTGV